MTKDEARKKLENYLNIKSTDWQSFYRKDIVLPIIDEIAYTELKDNQLEEYSFIYLIKLAYGLSEKHDTE